jgi:hypothetical protein
MSTIAELRAKHARDFLSLIVEHEAELTQIDDPEARAYRAEYLGGYRAEVAASNEQREQEELAYQAEREFHAAADVGEVFDPSIITLRNASVGLRVVAAMRGTEAALELLEVHGGAASLRTLPQGNLAVVVSKIDATIKHRHTRNVDGDEVVVELGAPVALVANDGDWTRLAEWPDQVVLYDDGCVRLANRVLLHTGTFEAGTRHTPETWSDDDIRKFVADWRHANAPKPKRRARVKVDTAFWSALATSDTPPLAVEIIPEPLNIADALADIGRDSFAKRH